MAPAKTSANKTSELGSQCVAADADRLSFSLILLDDSESDSEAGLEKKKCGVDKEPQTESLATATAATQTETKTPAATSSRLFEIVGQEHDLFKTIHSAITTMYETALPSMPSDKEKAKIAAMAVTDSEKALAYQAAEHAVTVLRNFQTILENLEEKGRVETALLLVDFVSEAFEGLLACREQRENLLQGAAETETEERIECASINIAINKNYGEVCGRAVDAFPNQFRTIYRYVQGSGNSDIVRKAAFDSIFSTRYYELVASKPKGNIRQAMRTWSGIQRALLTKFVKSSTEIYPQSMFKGMASNYIEEAEHFLRTLDPGSSKPSPKNQKKGVTAFWAWGLGNQTLI